MKNLFFKSIKIVMIIAFFIAAMYQALLSNLHMQISTLFIKNIESEIVLNIISFLMIYLFIVFMLGMLVLFVELPIYFILGFKKADNAVAYKYKDSGDSIYNRELPKYNAALAGYIVDYTTDVKQDYIALFVELIERNIIKRDFEGNKLGEDITESTDKIKLTTSELFVINTYQKYKELTPQDFYTFKKIIQNEAVSNGFIKENSRAMDGIEKFYNFIQDRFENPRKAKGIVVVIGYIMFLVVLLLFTIIPLPFNIVVLIIAVLAFRYKFSMNRYTKLGKQEKENMAKFRSFIKTQTSLDQKDINDRTFEEFIPYAIVFDVNNIYQEKIEKMLKDLK